MNTIGVQFIPSMSRTHQATHRTRSEVSFRQHFVHFTPAFFETLFYSKICIKNKTVRFLSIAAVAAFASLGAHADEADASQFATQFETQRTRAEVRAEAVVEAKTHSMEPAGSRVATYQSTAVRAQAAEAVRTGQISHGEIGNAM